MKQHVILAGFGHVGYRCFKLLSRLGVSIAVISDQPKNSWTKELVDYGATCFQGDARDPDLLEKAGIAQATAILIVTDQDITNISVAIDARTLNPNIRLVVRLFDQLLAARLKDQLGIHKVYSTSFLAGPIFSASALGQNIIGQTSLGDTPIALCLDTYLNLKPKLDESLCLGLFSRDKSGRWLSFNSKKVDHDSDVIVAMSSNDKLFPKFISESKSPDCCSNSSLCPKATTLSRVRLFCSTIAPEMKAILVLLALMFVSSLIVFHFLMNLSYIDSLYFAVTIFTSTGFGDYNFSNTSWPIKLYGIIAMLCGTALLATVVGIVQDFVLSARLRELLYKRERPQKDHHILVGFGSLGYRITEMLSRCGEPHLVIDYGDVDRALEARRSGVSTLRGDPRDASTLSLAGVENAKSLLLLHDDPVLNLGVSLLAKSLNPKLRTVLRSFDPTLGEKLQTSLNLEAVLSMSAASAPSFVASALFPSAQYALQFQNRLLVILQGAPTSGDEVLLNHLKIQLIDRNGKLELLSGDDEQLSPGNSPLYTVVLLDLPASSDRSSLHVGAN